VDSLTTAFSSVSLRAKEATPEGDLILSNADSVLLTVFKAKEKKKIRAMIDAIT